MKSVVAAAEPSAVAESVMMMSGASQEPHFYSRYEHGCRPIWVTESKGVKIYKVAFEEKVIEYPSTRQLLMALDPRGKDNHLTFDRYFRTGRYQPEEKGGLLDLLAPVENPIILPTDLTLDQKISPTRVKKSSKEISVAPSAPPVAPSQIIAAPATDLGIDLAKRGHEVAKLMYAGFARRILRAGYDPEDVLQEVYRGILARNIGKCPFDVRKSSFGHYVHMVIGCVLSNFHRREQRRMDREKVGVMSYTDDGWRNVDVAEANIGESKTAAPQFEVEMDHAQDSLLDFLEPENPKAREFILARQVLPLVRLGMSRKEIAAEIGVSRSTVSKVLAFIKSGAREWGLVEGILREGASA